MTNLLFSVIACFTWTANTEPDLAGYIIHYGTVPGVYENQHVVGRVTNACIEVPRGVTNYFTITAINFSAMQSRKAPEIFTNVPTVKLDMAIQAVYGLTNVSVSVQSSSDLTNWQHRVSADIDAQGDSFFRGVVTVPK